MDKTPSIQVATSTWSDIRDALNTDKVCVLPVGAECKEHGLHLPLNTDYVQAKWLANELSQHVPLIVWPVITAGFYPAFTDYPGSWSISETTFIACVTDIVDSIARHGENKIVLLNTGISTIRPLETMIEHSHYADRVQLLNVYSGPALNKLLESIQQQAQGGHADEIETSIMLAIQPDNVHMQRAQPGLEDIHRGKLNLHDPQASNYCPTGAMGNPLLASREKGEKLIAAIMRDLIQFMREL